MNPHNDSAPAWLAVVASPQAPLELRVSDGRGRPIAAGWFDSSRRDELWSTATQHALNGSRVELAVNPVLPRTPTDRALDPARKGDLVQDRDIARRTLLVIALKPRTGEVSPTDLERILLRLRRRLSLEQWPEPLVARAEGQLVYAIDLPADDQGLIESVLRGIAVMLPPEQVEVDIGTGSRLTLLPAYGARGVNLPEVPPAGLKVVTASQLHRVACLAARAGRDEFPLPDFVDADRRLLFEDGICHGADPDVISLKWLVRWAKIQTGNAAVCLPKLLANDLLYGDCRYPEPIRILRFRPDKVAMSVLAGTPRWPEQRFESFPPCACPPGCPVQTGCRFHTSVLNSLGYLGAAERCRVKRPKGQDVYKFPQHTSCPERLATQGWSQADAAAFGPVFLPAAALVRARGVGLPLEAADLLLWLLAQIWRHPASGRRDGAVVLTGSAVHGPLGSPELWSDEKYVSLGTHSTAGIGSRFGTADDGVGLVSLFVAWDGRRPTWPESSLLETLGWLAMSFGLTIAGYRVASGEILTLDDMKKVATARGHRSLFDLRLRVFAPADYPRLWSDWFALQLVFRPRPLDEADDDDPRPVAELPGPSTRVYLMDNSTTLCRIGTPDAGLAEAIARAAIRDYRDSDSMSDAPLSPFLPPQQAESLDWGPGEQSRFLLPVGLLPVADRIAAARGFPIVRVPSMTPPQAPVSTQLKSVDPGGTAFHAAIAAEPRGLIECGRDLQTRFELLCRLARMFPETDWMLIAGGKDDAEHLAERMPAQGQRYEVPQGLSPNGPSWSRRLVVSSASPTAMWWEGGRHVIVAGDAVAAARANPARFLADRGDRVYGFVEDLSALSETDAATVLGTFGPVIFRVDREGQ
jgi:hypothetical protein